jgi:hypothetical protein
MRSAVSVSFVVAAFGWLRGKKIQHAVPSMSMEAFFCRSASSIVKLQEMAAVASHDR